jgi:hypothetical protein
VDDGERHFVRLRNLWLPKAFESGSWLGLSTSNSYLIRGHSQHGSSLLVHSKGCIIDVILAYKAIAKHLSGFINNIAV